MELKNKHCLVIGANSFLGKEIIKALSTDNDVTGVFNINSENLVRSVNNVPVKDLKNLPDNFDIVFLISAHITKGETAVDIKLLKEVNEDLPKLISEQFKKARIVYASSVSVYEGSEGVLNESSAINAISEYAKSKLKGEIAVNGHSGHAIVRISSMYGTGMKKNTFLPLIINSAKTTGKIKLSGDGSRMQNYIHVSDVARICICAGGIEGNNIYLAADNRSYSNLEIAMLVKSKIPGTEIVFEGEDASRSYFYDSSFTLKTLNYRLQKNIETDICDLIT